jgi:glycosyltransferase involved in cell wall biosynthesis
MRIAFVLNGLRTDGGVQTSTAVMANALQRLGHEVLMVSLQGQGPLTHRLAGVPEFTDRHAVKTRAKVALVRQSLRDWRPDIVHSQLWSAGLSGRIAAMIDGIPSAFTEVTVLYPELSWRRLQVDRLLARRTDLHIAVSESSAVAYAARTGIDPRAVHVVANAIEPSWLDRGSARDSVSSPVRLLMVARLETLKNVDIALRAVAELRAAGLDARLTVLGDGPMRDPLTELARQLGLGDAARFEGITTEVQAHLHQAQAFLVLSDWEGCPMVLLEAAANGLPIIGTRVAGISELTRDEHDALLVARRSPSAVADAVRRLVGDDQLVARLSAGARSLAARHSADDLAPRLAGLYAETVQRRAHRLANART